MLKDRVVQDILLIFTFLGELACYLWILSPSKIEEAVKIVLVGFVATPVFLILCGIIYSLQRRSRENWSSFDRVLYRLNCLMAMYPIIMGALIYVRAWIQEG